jgi:hypothetical protein
MLYKWEKIDKKLWVKWLKSINYYGYGSPKEEVGK